MKVFQREHLRPHSFNEGEGEGAAAIPIFKLIFHVDNAKCI